MLNGLQHVSFMLNVHSSLQAVLRANIHKHNRLQQPKSVARYHPSLSFIKETLDLLTMGGSSSVHGMAMCSSCQLNENMRIVANDRPKIDSEVPIFTEY